MRSSSVPFEMNISLTHTHTQTTMNPPEILEQIKALMTGGHIY